MQFGRHLSICLTLTALVTGCVNTRYIGATGRDGVYANRGYGFAVRLTHENLDKRWRIATADDAGNLPASERPQLLDESLDLDGNGEVHVNETTRFERPTLLLVSTDNRSRIEVDFRLLSRKMRKADLDGLLRYERMRLPGDEPGAESATSSVASVAPERLDARVLSSDFPTRITEKTGAIDGVEYGYLLAVIDQDDFIAEEGINRRQILRVTLRTPAPIREEMRQDFEHFLAALDLNRRGAPETTQEKW